MDDFDEHYDIRHTADTITAAGYKRVALQFPDELLHDSVPVFRRLKHKIGSDSTDLYVLADTSYGSCCVDEVAAQHVNADAIVHYGHACMSLTSRLPVLYVFGKKHLDIEHCVSQLVATYSASHPSPATSQKIALLRHELAYSHLAEKILDQLQTAFDPLNITIRYTPPKTISTPSDQAPSTPNENDYSLIFYIGAESVSLTNLLITNASCDVFSYNPSSATSHLESTQTNKMLMRRYATMQKTRDADVFGIVVGTLGVASYLPLIRHLRTLLSSRQKKHYTLSIGKLSPSKLANFLEIDCFVLVACPENSLINESDAKAFFKPIVTPFELGIALAEAAGGEGGWTGRYVLDFEKVMKESAGEVAPAKDDGDDDDLDRPVFSLATGQYRHPKRYGVSSPDRAAPTTNNKDNALIGNEDRRVLAKGDAAAQFLQTRSYKGLQVRMGEDEPSVLEQGRSGIARGYQSEL